MAPPSCGRCDHRAEVRRPRSGEILCKSCFFQQVEGDVHQTIVRESMFRPGQVVAVGASGGKDSTVLIHLLSLLNERHQYGIDLRLVSIDEGIVGYRDDSLSTVHENAAAYHLPLHILSYRDLFGWTMDEIVKVVGLKNSCTYCGVLRRQGLERGASVIGADCIATGHNADDNAETLLMNVLRADIPRLSGSSSIPVPVDGDQHLQGITRVKPLKDLYQKDIVLYAFHKKLVYFTTECTYAQDAYRGIVRNLIKQLEAVDSKSIGNIIKSGEQLPLCPEFVGRGTNRRTTREETTDRPRLQACTQCGATTVQSLCRACVLLAGLEQKVASNTTDGHPQRHIILEKMKHFGRREERLKTDTDTRSPTSRLSKLLFTAHFSTHHTHRMVYIHQGKVVDKPPFSLTRTLSRVAAYAVLFVSSLLSIEPLADQVQQFQTRDSLGQSSYVPFTNILGYELRNGRSEGRRPTATGRSSTIRGTGAPPPQQPSLIARLRAPECSSPWGYVATDDEGEGVKYRRSGVVRSLPAAFLLMEYSCAAAPRTLSGLLQHSPKFMMHRSSTDRRCGADLCYGNAVEYSEEQKNEQQRIRIKKKKKKLLKYSLYLFLIGLLQVDLDWTWKIAASGVSHPISPTSSHFRYFHRTF
eukprot:gene6701-4799_t